MGQGWGCIVRTTLLPVRRIHAVKGLLADIILGCCFIITLFEFLDSTGFGAITAGLSVWFLGFVLDCMEAPPRQ